LPSRSCIIYELFSDGKPLFDLGRLLAYRDRAFDPTPALEKIDDVHMRVGRGRVAVESSRPH
jgi:phosphoinositide-3-kinase regulatory subunit 4